MMIYREEYDGSYLVCLEIGDEIIECLTEFARHEGIHGAVFEGIGAVNEGEIGYFDIEKRDYIRAQIPDQREMLSLKGNIALDSDGDFIVHAHVVLGDVDMGCIGGHLISGRISVTGEIHVRPVIDIRREPDKATGLKLWNLKKIT